jgi:hypothetical protein
MIPECPNGQLQPSRYDDIYKYLLQESDDYVGDDQTIGWTLTRLEVNRLDIVRAVSATGNPAASMAGAVETGHYLIRENSDGIIWAFYYKSLPDLMADYAEACEIDNNTRETEG